MSDPEFVYIYVLVDPRDKKIRYVGWATDLRLRFYAHLNPSNLKDYTHKNNWIKSLLSLGLKPEMETIQIVSYENRSEVEKEWIAFFGRESLTNSTNGGEGKCGCYPNEDTKKKMSLSRTGLKRTEELKQKMSKIMKNRIISSETKSKISHTLKGRRRENTSSKYLGVIWDKSRNNWICMIILDSGRMYFGRFDYETDAALMYNKKAIQLIGDNAELNVVTNEDIAKCIIETEKRLKIISEEKAKIKEEKTARRATNDIYFNKRTNKWVVRFTYEGKRFSIGSFVTETEAKIAANYAALMYYGHKAKLIEIPQSEIEEIWNKK